MSESRGSRGAGTTDYRIRDTEGRVRAVHVREDRPDGTKAVRWQRPDGTPGLNGTPLGDLPLYGAHELGDYDPDELIALVEGEKARDALAEAGIPALGTVTGASSTPSEATLTALRGRRVALWPDHDDQGHKHMHSVAERLHGLASELLWYEWPEAAEKGDDAADHPAVQSGGRKAVGKLRTDLEDARRWTPPKPSSSVAEQPYLTDLGNAERLVSQHGDDLRYVYAWGRWLVWSGARWEVDDGGEVERRAKETVRAIYAEAADAADSSVRKSIAAHAKASESRARLEAMISLAQSEPGIPARPADLDADPWLLNVPNGALDLRTGELWEHDRARLITKLAPVEYAPEDEAPTWAAFLERILPDPEVREFMRRMVGYALTGSIRDHILPVLYGSGSNGKSTFLNTLTSMLGEYGQSMAPDLLLAKKDSHPTELADLFGARMVTSVEVEDKRRFNEALVKRLTGDDPIKARLMRQDFWQFDPTHKPFLAVNHKPEVGGTDHAIWRRIKLVPFTVSIPDSEQDKELPEKLRSELPGILSWAVQGCLDWQRDGLGEPEEVRAATEGYRAEQDTLGGFISERCVIHEDAWCKFANLYNEYARWCEESGEKTETKRRFGSTLAERGFQPAKGTDNVSIRRGIAPREDGQPPPGGSPEAQSESNSDKPQNYPSSGSEGVDSNNQHVSWCKYGGYKDNSITEELPLDNPREPDTYQVAPEGITRHYSNSRFPEAKAPREEIIGNKGNSGNSGTSAEGGDANYGRLVAELFADPPSWLQRQQDAYFQDPGERLLKPLCAAVAAELGATAEAVRPDVRYELGEDLVRASRDEAPPTDWSEV